jgi:hypothetical protein
MKRVIGWVGLFLVCASSASAQVRWDSPFLVSPRPAPGVGIFLVDVAGGDIGALVRWQPTPTAWGLRIGLAEAPRDDVGVFFGGDVSGGITRASTDFPLDMDWVFGVGAGIADDVVVSLPIGLTLGHTFTGQGATFTPYLTPRLVLDAIFDGEDDLDLDFAVDLGLDLRLRQNWMIRFGATFGDREAIAIGLVF